MFVVKFINVCCIFTSITDMLSKKAKGISALVLTENAPEHTASFAFILEDKDAYPVVGFTWIHWLGANLKRNGLEENESQTATDFIQGANSWISIQGNQQTREQASYYGGMTPPDKSHTYELHIFALDEMLDLKNGFYLNELYEKMEGHILEEAILKGIYEK